MSVAPKYQKACILVALIFLQETIAAANWESMSPYVILPTSTLNSVWVSPDDQVFAVGADGLIVRYDGTTWAQMKNPVSGWLQFVWGRSSQDVFATGEGGLLHFDGESWELIDSQPIGSMTSLRGVGNGLFATTLWGEILRYNGSAMEVAYLAPEALLSIWGVSEKSIYAVGANGLMLHFNGEAWSTIPSGCSTTLREIWGTADDDLYIVGDQCKVHYDGHAFTELNLPPGNYQRIWGSSRDNIVVWGVETNRHPFHFNGSDWTPVEIPTSSELMDLNGNAADNIYAVGTDGAIVRYDGLNWQKVTGDDELSLAGVWGWDENDVYAVGNKGRVVHYDGTSWVDMPTPTTYDLAAVWGMPGEKMVAVGQGGTIIAYSGNAWTIVETATALDFNDVFGNSADNIFAVGDEGVIFHFNGSGWISLPSGISHNVEMVWVDSAGNVFMVSQYLSGGLTDPGRPGWSFPGIVNDYYQYHPGSGMELIDKIADDLLTSGSNRWGVSANDRFTVGPAILHYDGQTTAVMKADLCGVTLSSVWGIPDKGVYAVGSRGAIF